MNNSPMTPLFRAFSVLALTVLCACAEKRHPLDLHLEQLRPGTVSTLPDLGWSSGTLLCPMTAYQSALHGSVPPAERVNAFLARKKFLGEEGRWSLMVVKPATDGDAGIEHLMIKRAKNFDVINEPEMLVRDAGTAPAGFTMKTCVPVEQARILAIPEQRSHRMLIVFGTQ
jgi:hypothetical protein